MFVWRVTLDMLTDAALEERSKPADQRYRHATAELVEQAVKKSVARESQRSQRTLLVGSKTPRLDELQSEVEKACGCAGKFEEYQARYVQIEVIGEASEPV